MIKLKPARVRRLKLGFNPNSSSVGSLITAFLWSAGLGGVALQLLLSRLFKDVPPKEPQ